MKKLELVFVPLPAMGHLVPAVEFAKVLVGRDERLSISLLVLKGPIENPAIPRYIDSVSASFSEAIRFIHLPLPEMEVSSLLKTAAPSASTFHLGMELHKPLVMNAVHQLIGSDPSQLAGFVLDMWFASMIDVADALGVPCYVFYTSSAASLSLMFHLQTLHDQNGVDLSQFANSDTELAVPGFANPVPTRVLPEWWVEKEGGGSTVIVHTARKLRKAKGIMVNTFRELESHAMEWFGDGDGKTPPVYAVGPLMNSNDHGDDEDGEREKERRSVLKWLDEQPSSSVVFLCFGSVGGFGEDHQIQEIAHALEKSGYRFLWTLRQPPPPGVIADSRDYADVNEVLPRGFLDRTSKVGKVISWAPQMAVLAHSAIGGFISHCGWNSILESIWNGVPLATWPIFAEQQLNAFQLVKDIKIGVDIKLDYREGTIHLVTAHEIEAKIRTLMSHNSDQELKDTRLKMREKGSKALLNGGSSTSNIQRLIAAIITNSSSAQSIFK